MNQKMGLSKNILTFFGKAILMPSSYASTRFLNPLSAFYSSGNSQVKPFSEIPGPLRLPLIGNSYYLFDYILNSRKGNEILKKKFDKYGPIFRESIGQIDIVYLSDVDDIEKMFRREGKYPKRIIVDCWRKWRDENKLSRGIITGDGAEWKKMRQDLDKHMLVKKYVSTYLDTFSSVADDLILITKRKAMQNEGLVPNIDDDLFHWSLESACTMLYQIRLGGLSDPRPKEFTRFMKAVQDVFCSTTKIVYTPASISRIIFPRWQKLHDDSWDIIFTTTTKLINEKVNQLRKKIDNGEQVTGLLAHLISTGQTMEEIYGNIADIMLGAVDTTSMTVQWILYELANHPAIQEELYEELKSLPGCKIETFNDLANLSFLKAVLKETLRLYPIAMVASRILDEDIELSGYNIPKNTTFLGNMFLIGRNPRYFKSPLSFQPHRWLRRGEFQPIHAFAWLPFGFGPRSCIGRRIAELEIYLLVSKIVKEYVLVKVDQEPIVPVVEGLLSTDRPVNIKFVNRASI